MKATEAKLLSFIQKSPQFAVPIYQRIYSWGERECRQLWDDILRAGQNDDVTVHFVGSIVYVEKGLYQIAAQSPVLVIDGQQRLTSITLLLEALARKVGDSEPLDGFSANKLRNRYLLNPDEEGEGRYKLVLTQTDRTSLLALVEQRDAPAEQSKRIQENFEFFTTKVAEIESRLEVLCKGLAKLVVVDISLNRDQDNPQLIFESLNSTGRELSQADLIRNFVLMGLEPEQQTKLYQDYWRRVEIDFGQEAYLTEFDKFMRHYLVVKTGEIPNINAVYDAFKQHARSPAVEVAGVDALLAEIKAFARYYCAVALGKESDPELAQAFHDLRELKVDVAYPFLLELYHDYKHGILTKEDFLRAVRLVEGYVFRRAVCAIPTNSMNRTFAVFGRSLKKDRYLESVEATFLLLPSWRRFPRDEEFEREFQQRDLYNIRIRSYWLRRLENHDRKERVPVDEYTIEHVLPQNENLSAQWQTDLGPEWPRIQQTWLHTLGNLTLTGYNSELSDRPFLEKRDMKGGFADSPLRLNDSLANLDTWNESAIQRRAKTLATKGLDVWSQPLVEESVLAEYKPQTTLTGNYTIDDHPYLTGGPLREVFEVFRTQVLALDPVVTEEFLKLYVAYKAESNFVDVVPQAKRLRLSLNMAFPELTDPHGVAKDVTNLGRWGNGDIEVGLGSLEELPYVMGLVRQSFERQMGEGPTI